MKERLTKRKGPFVFINTDVIPRTNCKGEYGFAFCQFGKSCPSIATRKCPILMVMDRLAEYEDEAGKDVVEVIRCRDCKYWIDSGKVGRCYGNEHALAITSPDDFCSYGKRKEQG